MPGPLSIGRMTFQSRRGASPLVDPGQTLASSVARWVFRRSRSDVWWDGRRYLGSPSFESDGGADVDVTEVFYAGGTHIGVRLDSTVALSVLLGAAEVLNGQTLYLVQGTNSVEVALNNTHVVPAVAAATRLDSLPDLTGLFTVANQNNNQGGWERDFSGRGPTNGTGPGTNNLSAYVFSDSSGADQGSTPQATLRTRSTITALNATMQAWTPLHRRLDIRCCVTGRLSDWREPGEGMAIEGRHDTGDDWEPIGLVRGWPFANDYATDDIVNDVDGKALTIALTGGWVDFSFQVPAEYQQLRIYTHAELGDGGQWWRQDIALWNIRFNHHQDTTRYLWVPVTAAQRTVLDAMEHGTEIVGMIGTGAVQQP